MAKERDFPCPKCGTSFHFAADEIRYVVPCPSCGETLIMPHGRFDEIHVTAGPSLGGSGAESPNVLGGSSGWSTPAEREKLRKANIVAAIEEWERLVAAFAPPDLIKEARNKVLSNMFPKKVFHHNGKKYTKVSNRDRYDLVVTPD